MSQGGGKGTSRGKIALEGLRTSFVSGQIVFCFSGTGSIGHGLAAQRFKYKTAHIVEVFVVKGLDRSVIPQGQEFRAPEPTGQGHKIS
jgi:hypothetical protein